jgi:hypothetical protein
LVVQMAVCSTSLKCITCKSTTISNRIMQNTILPCFFFLALSLLGFFTGLRFTDTGRAAEHVLMEYNINGRVHVFIYGSSIYTHRPSCRACPPFATPCLWECHMSEKWGRVLCHAMRDKWRMHLASTSEASESTGCLGRQWQVPDVAHRAVLCSPGKKSRWGPPINGRRKKMHWRREKM